jgi:phosphoribosylaminoimidazolecarboxamide formyltransferase / IMP cyclohydrolase
MATLRRAILSVYNKKGISVLAHFLQKKGIKLLSTGGTFKLLKNNGIKVQEISDFTGFPEILEGRVKTLHPKIHGGILAKQTKEHEAILDELSIPYIDLVVCNLYPFEETINNPDSSFEDIIEMIDIGGPTMIRAAAKNFNRVIVVCDPSDYEKLMDEIEKTGGVSAKLKLELANKVFKITSSYDEMINKFLSNKIKELS